MYIETNFSTSTGIGNNPPNFKKARPLLKKRIDHRIAINPKQWRKGREPCYIAYIGQFRNSYLCVTKTAEGDAMQANSGATETSTGVTQVSCHAKQVETIVATQANPPNNCRFIYTHWLKLSGKTKHIRVWL